MAECAPTGVNKPALGHVMEANSQPNHVTDSTENGNHTNASRDSTLVKAEEHVVRAVPGHQPCFTGVAIHSDGRIILSDLVGYLCLYNPKDKCMEYVKLPYAAYSAVGINGHTLAVSSPDDMTIQLIDGYRLCDPASRVQKTFQTRTQPRYIISLNNGLLAVAWRNPPAFGVIDITGDTIIQKSYFEQDTVGRNFKSFEYLAVDESRQHVIQPCTEDEAVHCFDFQGNPVFMYKDAKLTSPRGVAVDAIGDVYVCDCSSGGGVHRLSPTGHLISVFTLDVPWFPTAICCGVSGKDFWVTQGAQPLFLITHLRLEQTA